MIFCLFGFLYRDASASRVDSLLAQLKNETRDSQRAKIMLNIAFDNNATGIAKDETMQYAEEALKLADKIHYEAYRALAYTNIARYYDLKADYQKELDNELKVVDITEKQGLKIMRANAYDNLSAFFRIRLKNDKKSLEYAFKELEIARQYKLKVQEATAQANIASSYYDMNDFKKALQYYIAAYQILDSLKKWDDAATMTNNIGSVYLSGLNDNDKAIEYYQKSLVIYQEVGDTDGIATALANIGNVYDMKGEPDQGIPYSLQALALARKEHNNDLVSSTYLYLSEAYGKKGDYKKALEYQTDLANLKDTIYNDANSKQVNALEVQYETDKKDKENKILELSVNRQKIINYSTLVGLLLMLAFGFLIYRSYVNQKKAHTELAVKNKIIEEKNKDIVDSINYAKTIQNAILTPDEYLKENLPEHFIIYKPRDVVSGDFYWCHASGDKVIFAVADCTGHGVPGAFMSMIGNSLLNEVVIEKKVTDAAKILDKIREGLLRTLQQKGQNAVKRDGMDIVLCVWDKRKNTIEYAGANSPLYLLRQNMHDSMQANDRIKIYGNLAELLPDKQPVGYYENKTENPFSSVTFEVKKGDIFYVSSDGFPDQFGGEAGKKFTRKRFREALEASGQAILSVQRDKLDSILEAWKGGTEQTDDICLMGVRIS